MLARLTLGAARLLDVHIQPSGASPPQDECEGNTLIVDLNALRNLLPNISDNSLCGVASSCGRAVAPICTKMQQMLSSDLEKVAQLLLDLEDNALNNALPMGLLEPIVNSETAIDPRPLETAPIGPSSPRKRRRSSHTTTPIIIPSTHSTAPTIVITLSPPQPREMSCRIPYQDQAFGELLTVPSYPAFNKKYPPMAFESSSLPPVENWKWENGHWRAVLPTVEEQTRRGMFSRPFTTKKRSCRSPHTHPKASFQAI